MAVQLRFVRSVAKVCSLVDRLVFWRRGHHLLRCSFKEFAKNLRSVTMPKIEVYSTAVCPYCVAAKNLLKAKGLEWSEVRVDTDPVQRDAMLERSGGRRTVPQIFINDQLVGGYDDLVAADRSGKLKQLLGEAA
jgi:glutaredoxin 3